MNKSEEKKQEESGTADRRAARRTTRKGRRAARAVRDRDLLAGLCCDSRVYISVSCD